MGRWAIFLSKESLSRNSTLMHNGSRADVIEEKLQALNEAGCYACDASRSDLPFARKPWDILL
jgi:hypothetical protein